jgi:hypothetical protein
MQCVIKLKTPRGWIVSSKYITAQRSALEHREVKHCDCSLLHRAVTGYNQPDANKNHPLSNYNEWYISTIWGAFPTWICNSAAVLFVCFFCWGIIRNDGDLFNPFSLHSSTQITMRCSSCFWRWHSTVSAKYFSRKDEGHRAFVRPSRRCQNLLLAADVRRAWLDVCAILQCGEMEMKSADGVSSSKKCSRGNSMYKVG